MMLHYRQILVNQPDYATMTGNELREELKRKARDLVTISRQLNEIKVQLRILGYSEERIESFELWKN